jgi:hypothetical protein
MMPREPNETISQHNEFMTDLVWLQVIKGFGKPDFCDELSVPAPPRGPAMEKSNFRTIRHSRQSPRSKCKIGAMAKPTDGAGGLGSRMA